MMKIIGSGSTRNVFDAGKKTIILDGITTQVNVCVKKAKKCVYDTKEKYFGLQQNNNEANESLNNYRVFKKIGENEYITNKSGVLTPILDYSDGVITTIKIEPYITISKEKQIHNDELFDCLLKTIDIHNISLLSFYDIFIDIENNKKNVSNIRNKFIFNKHQTVNTIGNLIINNYISGYDITESNWGLFTHPTQGYKKPILLDYGMNSKLMGEMKDNKYRMATL